MKAPSKARATKLVLELGVKTDERRVPEGKHVLGRPFARVLDAEEREQAGLLADGEVVGAHR
jgi:hypothetical protein